MLLNVVRVRVINLHSDKFNRIFLVEFVFKLRNHHGGKEHLVEDLSILILEHVSCGWVLDGSAQELEG